VSIISANVIACEDVLTEKATEIFSAIKILSAFNLARSSTSIALYSLATVFSTPGDHLGHVMSVRIKTPEGLDVAVGSDYPFSYGYKVDPQGYGGF
jgi:hypothetical protein